MLAAADEMNGCRQGAGSTVVSATLNKALLSPTCKNQDYREFKGVLA